MTTIELRKKEYEGLTKLLNDERKKLFEFNMNYIIGKDKDLNKKRDGKKLIARILTVIREKEIING